MLAAATAGRLVVFLLLRRHWGWQPPYHLVYLQKADELGPWVVNQFGLRYLATAIVWLVPIGALWYGLRRPNAHPLLTPRAGGGW